MNLPPLAGAGIVAVAIVLQLVASRLHADGTVEWITSLAAFGTLIMWGSAHASDRARLDESRAELEQLHKSLVPPREPSVHTVPPLPPEDKPPVVK